MAYNLNQRFASSPPYFRLFDPGAYQNICTPLIKNNNAPFLSKTERNIQSGSKLWTHAIYSNTSNPHIPNCTSLMSKIPRFSYEKLNNVSNIENMLCQCEDPNVCDCESDDKSIPEVICQGKIRRVLYKGPPPRSNHGEGISARSKRDKGFEITKDGSHKRVFVKPEKECPPFYNTEVNESTAFYRGCKWSHRTGKTIPIKNDTPGPAHYTLEHEPSFAKICAEKVRSHKRKTSKQLRFIEIVQRRNILDNLPGPSTYSPQKFKETELSFLGSQAPQFTTSIRPGPTDYWLKRDFDPPAFPNKLCKARLPQRAPFLSNSTRLKPPKIVDLSPASYDPVFEPCKVIRCSKAPFLVSSKRFTETVSEDEYDDFEFLQDPQKGKDEELLNKSWQFKSKTVRFKPLEKQSSNSISLMKKSLNKKRLLDLQYSAPFYSSEQRFRPWYNWIPVFGKEKTPGPSYYTPEKVTCYLAVRHGPLTKVKRFPSQQQQSPAPNEYKIVNGVETILQTHNQRLKNNISNRHKFHWSPPGSSIKLSNEENELILLKKSIMLLNTDDESVN